VFAGGDDARSRDLISATQHTRDVGDLVCADGAHPRRVNLRPLAAVSSAIALVGCASRGSVLDPAGPSAERIAVITWTMSALGLAVFLVVVATLLVALARRSRQRPLVGDALVIVGGGIVLPLLTLPVVWALTLVPLRDATVAREPELTIEVIGHQWWYEVRYESGLVLRDEMRVPSGVPVRLRLRSADVIHSFWAPRLAGKMDLIPGRTNELVIEASRPGTYLVMCAEFCGLWHARMRMEIRADEPATFARWLAAATTAR
jgi:cytochrome c oxidase subunit 2